MRTKPEKPTSIAAKGVRTAAERGDRVEKRENTALWPIEPSRKIEFFPDHDSSSGVRPDIPPNFLRIPYCRLHNSCAVANEMKVR